MLVGSVGSSVGSLSFGAGSSASGMMPLIPIEVWKLRTAVTLRTTEVRAMMQLAGDGARRGVRMARRKAAPVILVAGRILDDV